MNLPVEVEFMLSKIYKNSSCLWKKIYLTDENYRSVYATRKTNFCFILSEMLK